MAILIDVLTDDNYLCELLRARLTPIFPNAYIERRGNDLCEEHRQICDRSILLYDNRIFKISEPSSIPVFKDGHKADCAYIAGRISSLIKEDKEAATITSLTGRSNILLPFTYISERESLIESSFSPLVSDSDFCIRLDFMSGLRMPPEPSDNCGSGSYDALLQRAGQKDFVPSNILDYCNPDCKGFLTPGRPTDPDMVFDCDRKNLINLLKGLRTLSCSSSSPSTSTLCVIEGFRLADTLELTAHADNIHILLPSDESSENSGLGKIPSIVERSLKKDQTLKVHYSGEYMKGMTYNARTV